jgi:antiviral helicase SLH1
MDINGFLKTPREDVEPLLQRVRDEDLYEPLLHGIGFITANMAPSDMALVLELFAGGVVRALIAPREACWSLPVRSENVIVMGAQYIQMHEGERRVVNYSRTELVRMQGFATTSALPIGGSDQGSRMFVLCQGEQRDTITRALNRGLPLESDLPALLQRQPQSSSTTQSALDRMLKSRSPPPKPQLHRPRAQDLRKRDMMDLLSWTYLALRVRSNPTYYDIYPGHEEEGVSRLIDEWYVGNEYGAPMGMDKLKLHSSLNGSKDHSEEGAGSGDVTPEVAGEVVSEDKVGEKDGEQMDTETNSIHS